MANLNSEKANVEKIAEALRYNPVRLMPHSTRILPAELKKAWAIMVLATRANSTKRMAFEWRKRSTRSTQFSLTRVRAMVPVAGVAARGVARGVARFGGIVSTFQIVLGPSPAEAERE